MTTGQQAGPAVWREDVRAVHLAAGLWSVGDSELRLALEAYGARLAARLGRTP